MNLKDLIAKVTGLEARATEAFKAELAQLKADVTGTIEQLKAELATATASLTSLGAEKAGLEATISELNAKASDHNKEFLGFNDFLTEACLNGKLLDLKLAADATPEQIKAAALAVPVADKFKAYQGALNAAFAKAGLPNKTLPTPPAGAALPSAAAGAKKIKLTDFRSLNPKQQSDFCAAVRKGEAVLEMD